MKDIKFIKIKDKTGLSIKIQNLLLSETNAGLISLSIHRACKKFVKDLEKIPLSSELQDEKNRY